MSIHLSDLRRGYKVVTASLARCECAYHATFEYVFPRDTGPASQSVESDLETAPTLKMAQDEFMRLVRYERKQPYHHVVRISIGDESVHSTVTAGSGKIPSTVIFRRGLYVASVTVVNAPTADSVLALALLINQRIARYR